jgi:hypothetical protein
MCGARPVQSLRWSMCTGRHDMSARTAVGDSVGRTTDTCPDQGWSSGAGANRARIATGWTICGSGGLVGLGYLRDASGCGPGCRCPVLPARLPSPSGTSDGKADPVCAVEHLYDHPDGRSVPIPRRWFTPPFRLRLARRMVEEAPRPAPVAVDGKPTTTGRSAMHSTQTAQATACAADRPRLPG